MHKADLAVGAEQRQQRGGEAHSEKRVIQRAYYENGVMQLSDLAVGAEQRQERAEECALSLIRAREPPVCQHVLEHDRVVPGIDDRLLLLPLPEVVPVLPRLLEEERGGGGSVYIQTTSVCLWVYQHVLEYDRVVLGIDDRLLLLPLSKVVPVLPRLLDFDRKGGRGR
jgi:hypothetical protein